MRATDKELKDTLWKAANKLRGSLSASHYKDVILGLVYLKHASDSQWNVLAHNAESPNIGRLVDDAMAAATLPRLYENLDPRRLGELVRLLDGARFGGDGGNRARDLMGEVYEYFLGNFARAEGRRGGNPICPSGFVSGSPGPLGAASGSGRVTFSMSGCEMSAGWPPRRRARSPGSVRSVTRDLPKAATCPPSARRCFPR
jgi:type I restriction-modification system DNA methylase subunit